MGGGEGAKAEPDAAQSKKRTEGGEGREPVHSAAGTKAKKVKTAAAGGAAGVVMRKPALLSFDDEND